MDERAAAGARRHRRAAHQPRPDRRAGDAAPLPGRRRLEGQPYALRALVSFGANLLLANGDTLRGRAALDAALGTRARARIVIEASTDSEWVARCLEALGHEVIVADPNFASIYAARTRKVKTDKASSCRAAPLLALMRPLNLQLTYSPVRPKG